MELPVTFLNTMKELLGEEFEDYLSSFETPCFQGLRINTVKTDVDSFCRKFPFELKKIPWMEHGFYYEETDGVTRHPWYYAGLYYVQEPSAMIPASRLPVEPGDFVLDLCAAPGGKATELGAKLRGKGMLLANDISNSRAKALLKNLELFGIPNLYVSSENSEKLSGTYPAYFDKILIDAPCSGEGMFRKNPAMIKDWKERGPAHYVPIQRQLLLDAVSMLKPGGMLLYSTCTFSVEENEENIAFLLEKCPNMKLAKPKWNDCFTEGKKTGFEDCIRIFPHRAEGEGHFAALLVKEGNASEKKRAKDSDKDNKKLLEKNPELADFLKLVKDMPNGQLAMQQERVYLLPEHTEIMRSIRYLRTGLYLGDIKKGRFTPSQAFAMYLKKDRFAQTVSFAAEDERVRRYLKGETLELSETEDIRKGWVLVCVDDFGLGWAKAVNGTLRNKYYAGWRMQT